MESNAFSKSQNTPPNVNLLLSASNNSFISLKEAFSVDELFLNPYCSIANVLFWLMCWYDLEYITFSRIFEKDVSKEMGLKWVISVLCGDPTQQFTAPEHQDDKEYVSAQTA